MMPTNVVFTAEQSVVVVDEPHEVMTKLRQGSVQFQQANGDTGPVHLINPALILYLEKVDGANGHDPAAG
jgi:hypothetical protein